MMVLMRGKAEGRTGGLGTVWGNWEKQLCVCWGGLCMMGTHAGWFWYHIWCEWVYAVWHQSSKEKKELKICFVRITLFYVYKLLFVQNDWHTHGNRADLCMSLNISDKLCCKYYSVVRATSVNTGFNQLWVLLLSMISRASKQVVVKPLL